MAATFLELHSNLRAEIGDYFPVALARKYVKDALREISNRNQWSWLLALGEIIVPASIQGNITVTKGALTVVVDVDFATLIDNLGATPNMPLIGRRQLRVGFPGGTVLEIRSWDSATRALTVNFPLPLEDGDYTGSIVYAYLLPPKVEQALGVDPTESPNFKTYITVRDKTNNFALILEKTAAWLDKRDPRRDSTGTPTHLLQMAPTTSRLAGAGNDPNQIPPGTMRHELWPQPTNQYVYDALYQMRYWDLPDNFSTLPENLNPDLVHNAALARAYRWALGQSKSKLSLGALSTQLQLAITERERLYLDDFREDKLYFESRTKDLLGGTFPWIMGAAYAQVHDVNLMAGLFTD